LWSRDQAQRFGEWKGTSPRCGREEESEEEWQRAEKEVLK
jgi:hypothetical protein